MFFLILNSFPYKSLVPGNSVPSRTLTITGVISALPRESWIRAVVPGKSQTLPGQGLHEMLWQRVLDLEAGESGGGGLWAEPAGAGPCLRGLVSRSAQQPAAIWECGPVLTELLIFFRCKPEIWIT